MAKLLGWLAELDSAWPEKLTMEACNYLITSIPVFRAELIKWVISSWSLMKKKVMLLKDLVVN